MSRGIYVALSGAIAQENALDATATNVANASSTGYQRLRPVFRQVLANADPQLRYGALDHTALDTEAGAIKKTGRSLDVAMPAGTYLAVTTPRGERYTRAGSLVVAADGTLKTTSGTPVAGDIKANPIGEPVQIAPDGTVKQGKDTIGSLKLVTFEKPEALASEGASTLAVGGAGAVKPSTALLEVGALEESNAQPVTEMTSMMTASRTFEAFQKVLDTLGEVDRKLLTTVPNGGEE